VQFSLVGSRRTITLGKMDKTDAVVIGRHIERLKSSLSSGTIPADTAAWIDTIRRSPLEKRLAKLQLLSVPESATVKGWTDRYIASRPDVKELTRDKYRQCQRQLVTFFGNDRSIDSINAGDVDEFRAQMVSRGLSENTVRRRLSRARQMFAAAIRARLIDENPFSHLPVKVKGNRKRFHFVSREDYERLIDACPDTDWRVITSLVRIGGLRSPSEVLPLTWADVDWARERLRVRSEKTAHHDFGDERIIPLFPELADELRAAYELAGAGTVYIINRYRSSRQNLRTTFNKIVQRAGLKVWPKPFVNMRASRAIELVAEFPQHICTAWMGHSARVAAEHYLQVRDEDFDRALQRAAKTLTSICAQNEISRGLAQPSIDIAPKNGVCADMREREGYLSPRVGLEPTT